MTPFSTEIVSAGNPSLFIAAMAAVSVNMVNGSMPSLVLISRAVKSGNHTLFTKCVRNGPSNYKNVYNKDERIEQM